MQSWLSVVYITQNAQDTLYNSLKSVRNIADEIIVIDDFSKDNTVDIASRFGAKVFKHRYTHEGKQKAYALSKAKYDWTLVIESDEVVSRSLAAEIKKILRLKKKETGYEIPFKNYFLNKHVRYGGQSYNKLRLFNRKFVYLDKKPIHAEYRLKKGRLKLLNNKIHHYSYRSIPQLFLKFTRYGIREAEFKKKSGEKTGLKKIFLYPLHMFWARFIKDKGYKDGIFRIPLDLAFAYMEFLTYLSMLFIKRK